ncbi:hypothetical protein SBA4_3440010 [Candidatus Sulfopaludibacter sp. SbA4]|nr:hypothetical protein SBA4_3440010 [Candidatus Sulfopaludibacter sp. SbA4]
MSGLRTPQAIFLAGRTVRPSSPLTIDGRSTLPRNEGAVPFAGNCQDAFFLAYFLKRKISTERAKKTRGWKQYGVVQISAVYPPAPKRTATFGGELNLASLGALPGPARPQPKFILASKSR